MKAKAVFLHGENDLRLEDMELPQPGCGEILAEVITDSLCMSSYKTMIQGRAHRCVPDDVAQHPVILGHELCGRILSTGEGVSREYRPGMLFAVQAKMDIDGNIKSPGYSYCTYGGNATAVLIPEEVVRGGYLLPFCGDAAYKASLAEPVSCLLSALRSSYHCVPDPKHHVMGLRAGGSLAILAGCGPMGLAAAELAMSLGQRPARIVVTDIDSEKVRSAEERLRSKNGVRLTFVNTAGMADPAAALCAGGPFDDVLVMAPVAEVISLADRICGPDGCINFFAGPPVKQLEAPLNFYDVHYNSKHVLGTSGGDLEDMRDALAMIEDGRIDMSFLVSHIGGLNCAAETTAELPRIPGGKKVIYCSKDLPLTSVEAFGSLGETSPFFAGLARICEAAGGKWCRQAEEYLLREAPDLVAAEGE